MSNTNKSSQKLRAISEEDTELAKELELIAQEESRPCIPEGRYQVNYVGHNKLRYFGSDKLYINFEICDLGLYNKVPLFRAYNFYSPLLRGSDLYKDLVFLIGKRVSKGTRLPISLFKNKILEVQVRTVLQNRKQTPHSEHQKYSVIDKIIKIAAGSLGVVT